MSGLVFKGDVIYSTGEYLPAPYVNKISVEETEITIENFIFLDDYNDVDLVDSDFNISNSREEYKNKVLNDLKYYILVLKDYPEIAESSAAEIFEQIVNKTLNPFMFYHGGFEYIQSVPILGDMTFSVLNNQFAELREIDTDSISSEDFYDETGNRVTAYAVQTSFTIEDDETDIDHYYVFCFASTFDYFSDSSQMDEDNFNSTLFDLQIGDVSYEKVYEDGELAIQDSIKFYDGDDNLYEKVPLQTIDVSVHKIGDIDHDYIKSNIESLLEEYSTQYNSETGYDKIKNVMNAIYSTLELHYEKYDIISRLNQIRKSFSNKTPVEAIGKLYKRFSKRLFNINKTVMQYEQVYKKIVYNSKIVDLRSLLTLDTAEPSYDEEAPDEEYLYSDWQASHVLVEQQYSAFEEDEEIESCVAGYFFFDYEKALRTKSNISSFLNVNRLESLGLSVPYQSFNIDDASISRIENYKINTNFNSDSSYPIVDSAQYDSVYIDIPDSDFKDKLVATVYGSDAGVEDMTAANGFISSLVNRAYTGIYDSTSGIDNYRLMCFELLEYIRDSAGDLADEEESYDFYETEISITDSTNSLIGELSSSAYNLLEEIKDYQVLTEVECVFNSDLGRFNKFFLEGALSKYSDQPTSAPWYTAPASYIIHLDLFYNEFEGDLEEIENAVKNISSNINPKDGTTDAIGVFIDNFEDLLDNIYSSYTATEEETITFSAMLPIPESQEISIVEVVGEEVEDDTGIILNETAGKVREMIELAVELEELTGIMASENFTDFLEDFNAVENVSEYILDFIQGKLDVYNVTEIVAEMNVFIDQFSDFSGRNSNIDMQVQLVLTNLTQTMTLLNTNLTNLKQFNF